MNPAPIGYILAYDDKTAKAASCSSFGGYVTRTAENAFGQRCQSQHEKAAKVWRTKEAAERNAREHNERAAKYSGGDRPVAVEPIFPTDWDVRDAIKDASFKPDQMIAMWQSIQPPGD